MRESEIEQSVEDAMHMLQARGYRDLIVVMSPKLFDKIQQLGYFFCEEIISTNWIKDKSIGDTLNSMIYVMPRLAWREWCARCLFVQASKFFGGKDYV